MKKLTRTQFIDDLKGALVHLYDTEYLRQTHLLSVFHLENRFDASTVFRNILIATVLLFFAACLVAFYLLARLDVPLGIPFYLWVGVFNMMVVAQFWSFANDIYTPEQGKRLFAIVAFGASAGAVLGSWVSGRLIGPLGVEQMLVVAAAILVSTLLLTNVIEARERKRRTQRALSCPTTTSRPRCSRAIRPWSADHSAARWSVSIGSRKTSCGPSPCGPSTTCISSTTACIGSSSNGPAVAECG